MSGPVTTGSTTADTSDDATDSGPVDDLPSCDPLADPIAECGVGMACDLTSQGCVPATGTGLPGEPCEDDGQCSPGLACATGHCTKLCDPELEPELESGCEVGEICTLADAPIPGLCRTSCLLTLDDCVAAGFACKRAIGPDGSVRAACIPNPGVGLVGDACVLDSECSALHLCSPAEVHALPCTDGAPSCCAPVCDTIELLCFGLEPLCYTLGIPGQESSGFCGA